MSEHGTGASSPATAPLHASVAGIGVIAPGLTGWAQATGVLRGEVAFDVAFDGAWHSAPLAPYKLALLPANERRRATPLIQLALRAVEDCLGAPVDPAARYDAMASVFASSGGDMGNLNAMCGQLARDPKGVSPTAFHNSVHNAVAGYWSIGRSRAPSVSLSVHDASFLYGLLEALALIAERQAPVLLVAYDCATPAPLFAKRPVAPDVAVALLLQPAERHAPNLRLERLDRDDPSITPIPVTEMADAALEAVRMGNPAARSLPLLRLFALATSGTVVLGDEGQRWAAHYQI